MKILIVEDDKAAVEAIKDAMSYTLFEYRISAYFLCF